MPFGVRDAPTDASGTPLDKQYAPPNCRATFPDTSQGKKEFRQRIRDHEHDFQ